MPVPHESGSASGSESADATEAGTAAGAAETGDVDAEDVPMNRAERRAKAKGKATGQPNLAVGKITPNRAGQAHGHRTYANRRGGGS